MTITETAETFLSTSISAMVSLLLLLLYRAAFLIFLLTQFATSKFCSVPHVITTAGHGFTHAEWCTFEKPGFTQIERIVFPEVFEMVSALKIENTTVYAVNESYFWSLLIVTDLAYKEVILKLPTWFGTFWTVDETNFCGEKLLSIYCLKMVIWKRIDTEVFVLGSRLKTKLVFRRTKFAGNPDISRIFQNKQTRKLLNFLETDL